MNGDKRIKQEKIKGREITSCSMIGLREVPLDYCHDFSNDALRLHGRKRDSWLLVHCGGEEFLSNRDTYVIQVQDLSLWGFRSSWSWNIVHNASGYDESPRSYRAQRAQRPHYQVGLPTDGGCLRLFEPVKCEETLVRMDQTDVRAVLKIMGYNWPAGRKKQEAKKKNTLKKKWDTKALDALVDYIVQEEDELVSWWRRPYCLENVQQTLRQSCSRQVAGIT
ncbi:unnamed protein product [Nesidiocoris tenuis]|uniref:Uncharacterized protein n=1 Tax=Nesidiocoris tenuis TaxID=355587 RepID=A0A6H5H486_9HEMI|nr:unnamed protein product [Nesidiocoris tenuis]